MAKQHTTPYRLYKRGKVYHAYISFITKNGQRHHARLSTREIFSEKAEQFCLKYISAVNERASQGFSDKDLSAEKAFFLWFENKAKYYATSKDILRKLLILLPYFEKTFSQINNEDITRFMNDSRQKGRSNATINRYLSTLSAVSGASRSILMSSGASMEVAYSSSICLMMEMQWIPPLILNPLSLLRFILD